MTTEEPATRPPELGIADIGDVERVARGGFGIVYRGRQERFRRTVAIKVLDSTPDAKTLARFEQECQALGALSGHPYIVTILDAGSTPDGRPFLMMPFLPGGSLADRMHETGRLAWGDVLDIGVKVAGALATAHEAGLLHRDIKPENVLLSAYKEPVLADFGLARLQDLEMSQSTTILATPAHVSPEVIAGKAATVASDIYSLGSTLYALLYGGPAFVRPDDEHVLAVMVRLANEPPPDLRPLGVPDLVCRVLEWCMQKDPANRPVSARTFGEALQRAQARLGLAVTPLPVAEAPNPAAVARAFGPQSAAARAKPANERAVPPVATTGAPATTGPRAVTTGPPPTAAPPSGAPAPFTSTPAPAQPHTPAPFTSTPAPTAAQVPAAAQAPATASAPTRPPVSSVQAAPPAAPRDAVWTARRILVAVIVLLAFLGAGLVTGLVV